MHRLLMIVCCLCVAAAAMAAEFPDYPQFRYASGLPGGGNGVTPDGHIGFDGAMQVNIPVGYTPGWGNFMATASTAAINGGFPDSFKGSDVNGTMTLGFGIFHKHALWFSHMGTGAGSDPSLEPAYNVQVELFEERENRPGISIGVTDLLSTRADDIAEPFKGGARSVYVVATRECGTPERPLYLTLGLGTGRFEPIFGGVSYQPADRLKVFAEYDGLVPNVGAAYDLLSSREWHAIAAINLVDLERLAISLSVTKTDF